jgi:hypothetical protein
MTVSKEQYEVERIIDVGIASNGLVMYKVRWLGYDETEDTWEPLWNLGGAVDAVRLYHELVGLEFPVNRQVLAKRMSWAIPEPELPKTKHRHHHKHHREH